MKEKTETGKIYHIFNKSIAGYKIFNSGDDYTRMIQGMRFFSVDNNLPKFSQLIKSKEVEKKGLANTIRERSENSYYVDIIAYCLMPTHFHFILKQKKKDGINKFVGNLSNSYSRYFNNKYDRKGPLWQGRFNRIKVKSNEQIIHLTRYIHLNPTSAGLVEKPDQWKCSSYREFIELEEIENPLCNYQNLLDIDPDQYKEFVTSRIDYQRELEIIKKNIILE